MNLRNVLPANVSALLESVATTEFATLTKEGGPVDTPLLVFPAEDLSTLNVATGLAYPVKAERARRNPKVGMLLQGGENEPVVSVAGMAAVRDSDIQANALRYISETGSYSAAVAYDWSIAHQAVWYWSRMIVEVTPKTILWWDNRAAMDGAPHRWDAPADTVFPTSDPAPPSAPTKAPQWAEVSWREYLQEFIDRNARGHLTLLDADGFPLPMPVKSVRLDGMVLELDLPLGAPWQGGGKACFTYEGRATLVGTATLEAGKARMEVARMLPVLPLAKTGDQVWKPEPDVKAALMGRLTQELERRGQAVPVIPAVKPEQTPGSNRRAARMNAPK